VSSINVYDSNVAYSMQFQNIDAQIYYLYGTRKFSNFRALNSMLLSISGFSSAVVSLGPYTHGYQGSTIVF
jgi:hypothetical protein